MHDTRHNQHQLIKSDDPSDKISIKKAQNQLYHCIKLVRERISHHIFHWPLILPNEIRISAIKFFKWISQAFHFIALKYESVNQKFMAISKVIIIWAAPCISYQLGNINTIGRARMGYCSKGMENWQCGNHSHHVCHGAWCEVDSCSL